MTTQKKTSISILRQIIREEVEGVIKQYVPKILKEYINSKQLMTLEENDETDVDIPLTLNTVETVKSTPKIVSGNSVLDSMLMETARSMSEEDFIGFGGGPSMQQTMPQGPSGHFNPNADISNIQVKGVPDFNALMDKMIKKGEI